LKRIYFTVTNDLSFDQRMQRICTSLVKAGFDVVLVGRKLKSSLPLRKKSYAQKRISCLFNKGFLFYAEFNLRLFFFLLRKKMDGVCAIDLDTILPCLLASKMKRIKRVYDGHEFFTEMKEVRTRPFVKRIWLFIERVCIPQYKLGYTVSDGLAEAFHSRYHRRFVVVRNLPVLVEWTPVEKKENFLLYQGAVNEGRGFEVLIPALRDVEMNLVVCGDGNFMARLKRLIRKYRVKEKVELMGMLRPEHLYPIAQKATIGIGLAEKEGINQYLALPNKFLDYMHAGLPQLAMAYPEYKKINDVYKVAVLIEELTPKTVAAAINRLISDQALLQELHSNCMKAREVLCWQNEEKILVDYYHQIFRN
jgi:glycosyltransferase involved in cell wall biosynthesis